MLGIWLDKDSQCVCQSVQAGVRGGHGFVVVRQLLDQIEDGEVAVEKSLAAQGAGDGVRTLGAVTTIFLPTSMPWPTAGTLVEVFTLCASITQADGSASRPFFCRKGWRSRR